MTIRARLHHAEQEPPEFLYHGTVTTAVLSILERGITAGPLPYVCLSHDVPAAMKVGRRQYGMPIVLKIDALRMYRQGFKFYRSVRHWRTECVPERFILG